MSSSIYFNTLPQLIAVGSSAHGNIVPFHTHAGMEIILVLEGLSKTCCQGWSEPIDGYPGCLQLIPAGVSHDQQRHGAGTTTYVVLKDYPAAFGKSPRSFNVGLDSLEARWIIDLHRMEQMVAVEWIRRAQQHILAALISRLATLLKIQRNAAPESVLKAQAYIFENLALPLSAETISQKVFLSSSRLRALFKKYCGCPVLQYQQHLRMELARRLLCDPYLRVSEIAQKCGYDDQNYFARIFRKHCGFSPHQWTAANRGG